jgi:hypothetical protein
MLAITCNVCGALPDVGEAVSHGESLVIVKDSVPKPVLLTLTFPAAGLAPPWTALKDSEVVLRVRIGVDEALPVPYADRGQSL